VIDFVAETTSVYEDWGGVAMRFRGTVHRDDSVLADGVEGDIDKHPGALPSYGGWIELSEDGALGLTPGRRFLLDTNEGLIIEALVDRSAFSNVGGSTRVAFLSNGNPLAKEDLPPGKP
jgi:hypothetical protein